MLVLDPPPPGVQQVSWWDGCPQVTYPAPIADCTMPDSWYFRFAKPQNFDTANPVASFDATVGLVNLRIGSYMRVATLGEPNSVVTVYRLHQGETSYHTGAQTFIIQQADVNSGQLIPRAYKSARGYSLDRTMGTTSHYPDSVSSIAIPDPNPRTMSPLTPLPVVINGGF